MAVADVFDIEKKKVAEVELNDAVFGAEVNEATIHDVVKMQLASRRSGTSATKGRSDVQRRREKALASKRNRPRPIRNVAITDLERRRHCFRASASRLFIQRSQKSAEECSDLRAQYES